MKKIYILIIIISFCILFVIMFCQIFLKSMTINYDDWKSICLTGVGWIKVPQDWVVKEVDGTLYMTDGLANKGARENILLISVPLLLSGKGPVQATEDEVYYNTNATVISSTVLSNSTIYGFEERIISGSKKEMSVITFDGINNSIKFFGWDNLIDEDTLYKIAYSFTTGEYN